jgi:PKD repeat protein
MKKCLLGIIAVFFAFSVYAACYDDDNGINYKQKGNCRDTNGTEGSDSCISWGLVEYYCTSSNNCAAQIRTCENCKDGVCLSKEADEVQEVNKAPTVNFLVMAVPGKTEVAFKADVSDPEGGMAVFTIDFGDGTKASNKAYVSHDYKTNGTFKATLTAIDPQGTKTVVSKEFTIEPYRMVEAPKEATKDGAATADTTAKKGFFARIIDFFKGLFKKA